MFALIGNLSRPPIQMRLECGPALEVATSDRVLLDVADTALVLAFVRALEGAQARGVKPQYRAKVCRRSLDLTSRVAAS